MRGVAWFVGGARLPETFLNLHYYYYYSCSSSYCMVLVFYCFAAAIFLLTALTITPFFLLL